MTIRIACLSLLVFAAHLPAQSFEVASVKVSESRSKVTIDTSLGGVTMDATLGFILRWAYDLKRAQLSGPDSLEAVRYHVAARTPGPVSVNDLKRMTQALLAQRFNLAFHRETKEIAVYALVVAKGGPKLKRSDTDGESETKTDPKKPGSGGTLLRTTLAQLADRLDGTCPDPVVDLTGLKGRYDLTLDISSYMGGGQPMDLPAVLNEALQKQLGLNLVQRKAPIEMLIVDHAEKAPVEN